MTISKWLIALICSGSVVIGSMVTVAVQRNSECTSVTEQQQRDADASFEARPNTRSGVKGY